MLVFFLLLMATAPCLAITRAGVMLHNAPYFAIPMLLFLSLVSKDSEGG